MRLGILALLLLVFYGCSGPGTGNMPIFPEERETADTEWGFGSAMNVPTETRDTWKGSVEIDDLTWMADITPDGNVRWAAGEGIPVDDPLAFINTHQDIFKIDGDSLHTMSDEMHGDVRYCIYRQLVDGIEMIDTRIDLRIKYGNVILIGVDVIEETVNMPAPALSFRDAASIAWAYHPGDELHACRMFAKLYDIGYYPFWRVYIGDYYMEISAVDGYIFVDEEFLFDFDYEGEVSGYVSEVDPFADRPLMGLSDLDVFFYEESTYATTDLDGMYYLFSDTYTEMNTHVTPVGPWAEIDRYDYTTAYIDMVTLNREYAEFGFDDENSKHAERNVFYYTNIGHNYVKNIEPGFVELDRVIVSSVERNNWCNAMAGWGKMYYYKAKAPCINLAHIPDVVLHEYGHELVFFHYYSVDEAESPYDIHEGCADYLAATVTDQPIIGTNWRGIGTHIRNCDNTLWWPDNNCGGESHCLGQILAGAFWDVREALGREYADHIWHYAKYGIPQTFPEYAMEMCVADDDDGDLSNGTPNFSALYDSFDKKHGIPMPDAPYYYDVSLEIIPDVDPIEISSATGGSFGYTFHMTNNIGNVPQIEAWAAVLRPNGMWYGPVIPPSHYYGTPPTLYLAPYMNFYYHLVQNIPPGLAIGTQWPYHVRLGDYVDLENDLIAAEDVLYFNIVP